MMSESAEVLSAVVLREGGTRATVGERGTIVVRADAGWVAPCEGVGGSGLVAKDASYACARQPSGRKGCGVLLYHEDRSRTPRAVSLALRCTGRMRSPSDQSRLCMEPHHRTPHCTTVAASSVLHNPDLVAIILQHAELGPSDFVAVARVAKAWHEACRTVPRLLLGAAHRPAFLTKHTLMGLFVLDWREADALPRGQKARRQGGFLYKYDAAAIDRALPTIGGFQAWQRRIARRAARERAAAASAARGQR
jgi:hypothetical protein